jgi:hypothetical protein
MTYATRDIDKLTDYWRGLADGDGPPLATRFDPLDITFFLGRVALVEVAPTLEEYRFRVWGTQLTDMFGEERTWKRFGDLKHIENWHEVFVRYERVVQTGEPDLLTERLVSNERDYVRYHRVCLPLASAAGEVVQIVAGFEFERPSKD